MVLPVSGFLPVPLPMMIPFMGAQSLVIGKMFGEGFQYGKRKISAMPNEEFNKLTFESMMSNAREELKASVPTINASLHDMDDMVETVIDIFIGYLQKVITKAPQAVEETGKTILGEVTEIDEGSALDKILHAAGVDTSSLHAHGGTTSIPITTQNRGEFKQPTIPTPVRKRTANTRVKLTRIQLIRRIAHYGNIIKGWVHYKTPLGPTTYSRKPSGVGTNTMSSPILKQQKELMLMAQQQLVNLLNKYTF